MYWFGRPARVWKIRCFTSAKFRSSFWRQSCIPVMCRFALGAHRFVCRILQLFDPCFEHVFHDWRNTYLGRQSQVIQRRQALDVTTEEICSDLIQERLDLWRSLEQNGLLDSSTLDQYDECRLTYTKIFEHHCPLIILEPCRWCLLNTASANLRLPWCKTVI